MLPRGLLQGQEPRIKELTPPERKLENVSGMKRTMTTAMRRLHKAGFLHPDFFRLMVERKLDYQLMEICLREGWIAPNEGKEQGPCSDTGENWLHCPESYAYDFETSDVHSINLLGLAILLKDKRAERLLRRYGAVKGRARVGGDLAYVIGNCYATELDIRHLGREVYKTKNASLK